MRSSSPAYPLPARQTKNQPDKKHQILRKTLKFNVDLATNKCAVGTLVPPTRGNAPALLRLFYLLQLFSYNGKLLYDELFE